MRNTQYAIRNTQYAMGLKVALEEKEGVALEGSNSEQVTKAHNASRNERARTKPSYDAMEKALRAMNEFRVANGEAPLELAAVRAACALMRNLSERERQGFVSWMAAQGITEVVRLWLSHIWKSGLPRGGVSSVCIQVGR